MRIASIVIRHFRSVDDEGVHIELGAMAAFVGRNSSGKSNILRALQQFFSSDPIKENDFYYQDVDNPVKISITFPFKWTK